MIGALRLAIFSRIRDKDDFKHILITSDKDDSKVLIYPDSHGNMIYKHNGKESQISMDEIPELVEKLAESGYHNLTCECWSGIMQIDIPSEKRGKLKINYSQPTSLPDLEEDKNLIDIDEASELLEAMEILNSEGHMTDNMRRKYVQVDSFIKPVYPLLKKSSQQKKINILDCGTGKSYLSFAMNYFLREKMRRSCHFYCVDTNSELLEKCKRIKNQLNYGNMEFHVSSIMGYTPPERVDLVCSLHACDTATDEAIAKAINLEAPFLLVVPCCQHEIIDQLKDHPLKAITRHGVYKTRLADLLTDAMRTLVLEAAGYKVSVSEYVSPIYTPKNIMIQAERIQNKNPMAMKQYTELKSTFGNISMKLEDMLRDLTNDFEVL